MATWRDPYIYYLVEYLEYGDGVIVDMSSEFNYLRIRARELSDMKPGYHYAISSL